MSDSEMVSPRKRGRPATKKSEVAAASPPKKAKTTEAKPVAATPDNGTAVKRGRGRPFKNGVSAIKKPAAPKSPRGRGRPPKKTRAGGPGRKKKVVAPVESPAEEEDESEDDDEKEVSGSD